ncbi:MAG: hypothetical protein D6734_03095 [Candidatus Schekmanbacteria bacterium]|nr:MAG: hypothetical protein D6734_03095 [Candidatus Schekmanbacteria bacterium]
MKFFKKGVKSAFGFSWHFHKQQIRIFPEDLDYAHGFYLTLLQGNISRNGEDKSWDFLNEKFPAP